MNFDNPLEKQICMLIFYREEVIASINSNKKLHDQVTDLLINYDSCVKYFV